MKGPTSKKRLRPSVDTEFSVQEHILHSTAIEESPTKRVSFIPDEREGLSPVPVVINAPSGFPSFTAILQQHGFFVSKPRNYIQVDQLVFRKNLSDWLENKRVGGSGSDNETSKFMKGMEGYLLVSDNFIHSMTPTLHPDEVFQDSLLHNLLSIPALQPRVTKVLLPTISESSCTASSQEQLDHLATMLAQLKWLPNFAGVKSYTGFLLSAVDTATDSAKVTLVRHFPDIIPETHHPEVVSALKGMLQTADSPIVSAIMDCFSSLDISSSEWDEIRTTAINQMLHAPLQDFPAYFAFLFRTEDVAILSAIIKELRENLELIPVGGAPATNAVHMVEIVEKIRFCASVNINLVPTWTKQVKEDLMSNDNCAVTPLDFVMILIFAESFKSALVPLKLICLEEKLAIRMLDHLLKHNMPILNQVFQTLAKLCDSFLRNPKDSKAHPTAHRILVELFMALNPLETQEITSNLICILMNGDPNCREIVLQILAEVTTKDPKKLLMFAPHLMGVLESAPRFHAHQVRQLMNVLASLAQVKNCTESERFGVEFTILLRKYLTHSSTQIRCFGVMGTLATVHQLSLKREENEDSISELLKLAWSFVQREEEPCCIFFDELSNIISSLPPKMCQVFYELIGHSFVNSWTNLETRNTPIQKQTKLTSIKMSLQFYGTAKADDSGSEEPIALIFEERPLGMNPRVIPAHARLVFKLIAATQGDMSLILPAPVLFPDMELYYKKKENIEACTFSQRFYLGMYLLLGINFFRECLSAFVEDKDAYVQIQVWYRLSNVIVLQKVLAQNFYQFPSLPNAYITGGKTLGGDGASTSADLFKKPKAKGKFVKEKKVKNKKEGDEAAEEDELLINSDVSVQPLQLVTHLRKFDPAVFQLLKAPLNLNDPVDFVSCWSKTRAANCDLEIILRKVAKLQPEALSLLLLEINQQTRDKEGDFNLLEIRDLIMWIRTHLETIEDAWNRDSTPCSCRKLEEAFQLILTTLSYYFEKVATILDPEEKETFCELVLTGLGRVDAGNAERIRLSVEFLKNISNFIKKPGMALEHLSALSKFHSLFPESDAVSSAVVHTAEKYLKSDWKLSSSQVDLMLKTLILKSESPLTVMRKVTIALMQTDHVDFESCTPTNFHSWYSVLLLLLSQHASKAGKRATASGDGLAFWKEAILMFKDLVFITDTHRATTVLTALLKHSRSFIEGFTNIGTKILPSVYSDSKEEFKPLLKNLQTATRKLQIICEHSKVQRDTKLMRNVPQLKRALESLVFRVRELFSVNGVSEAFWLGSLRHKSIDGEPINSQPFNEPEREEEENNEDTAADSESEGKSSSEEDEYSFDKN